MKSSKAKKELKERKEAKSEVETLTKKQRELLTLVYRFRFVTAPQIAAHTNQSYLQTANERLNHLVMLGYLAKRQDSSYHLAHRPIEYYATTRCVKLFRELIEGYSEQELKQLYARPKSSERFVRRSTILFTAFLQLRQVHGERLRYSSKSELNVDDYSYFPRPLPDGFFILKAMTAEEKDKYFFLELFDDAVSIGIHGRQISKYLHYEEAGDWDSTGADFPTVVVICESDSMLLRAQKRIRYLTRDETTTIHFACSHIDHIASLNTSLFGS